ncbi:MAG: 4Fe-4S cluster-binding domain-containing protein [Patescibacteria group bacterium]|nr:4Fe-4S cluster-binding domain-containing protein [Patescibacteria group bacterium]
MGCKKLKIVINTIDYSGSIVDGPGLRTILFVQGCVRRCEECHNPSTWNIEGGIELEVEEIVRELNEKCINKKITISGGEPLLQFPAVLKLVKNLEDFNVVLYTGFELEDIPKEILKHINYVKVGRYIKKKRTTILPFIGSKNQKFIKIGGE